MQHIVYIGVGSNLGDRLENCLKAVEAIGAIEGVKVLAVSKWLDNPAKTQEWPCRDPDFINGAVKIETTLPPFVLLSKLQEIEISMGRPKNRKKGTPRTIDLDILLYDEEVVDSPRLKIPHPEMEKRVFVLKPLCDIEPAIRHPANGATVSELLARATSL